MAKTNENYLALNSSRREFLIRTLQLTGQLAVANIAIYSFGLISKDFQGSLTAGAKCAPASPPFGTCTWPAKHFCCQGPPDYWSPCLQQSPC